MYHPLFTVKNFQRTFAACPFFPHPALLPLPFFLFLFPFFFCPFPSLSAAFSLCISLFAFRRLLRRRPSAPFFFCLSFFVFRLRPFLSCFLSFASTAPLCSPFFTFLPLLFVPSSLPAPSFSLAFRPFPFSLVFLPFVAPLLGGHSRADARKRSAFGNARRTGADVGAQGQTSTAYT